MRRAVIAVIAVIVVPALLVGAGTAVTSRRARTPSDGPVAAALVRYAAESGVEHLVIRSDGTRRGRVASRAAVAEAARRHVAVEPDEVRAGPDDALLLLLTSPGQAKAHITIERPGRGVLLAPWLDQPTLLTAGQAEIIVAKLRGAALQLWTPANIAFLPPALSQGHDHGAHGSVRLALVRSSLPVER